MRGRIALILSSSAKQMRRPNFGRRIEIFEILREQEFYDDLYLTEQPYGLVCEVVTGLPESDSSSAAFT